ncbi:MAG: fibronectin type III domain-containing protein [Tannerella sp.]|jgi:hypothetical protein|nr:fibronectin type III domain-containing protein [Tannerella sp.]
MKKKLQEVLFRPLKRWRISAALAVYAVCFTFPAFGQQTQGEWNLTAGNESVTVEWSGLDVTSIAVEGTGRVIDRPASPCVITGLTNGQLYRFILNQPETEADNPLVGTWIPVRDEGYEVSGSERDTWEIDFPPQQAEEEKLTFLADGTAHNYDIFGLLNWNYLALWSLNDNVLTVEQEYDGEVYATSYDILSLTSSGLIFEEHITVTDIDRNGDGVINEEDCSEYYQKMTLRKVSPYISAYGIPGEPFVPRNVEVIPNGDGTATVNWTAPPVNDRYSTAYISYLFTLNGQLSYDFFENPSGFDMRAGTGTSTGTASNLPTDGQPYRFQLIAIRYLTAEENGEHIPVIGKSAPATVAGNNDVAATDIYASGDRLYVNTHREGNLTVYTPGGQLYRQQRISAGITSIPLAKGIYIVTFGDRTKKVYVH